MAKRSNEDVFLDALTKWKRRLLPADWEVRLCSDAERVKEEGDGAGALAVAVSDSRYQQAHIYYDPARVETNERGGLDIAACHELTHVVLSPFVDMVVEAIDALPASQRAGFLAWYKKEHEAVTTAIERIFGRVRKWDR